MNPEQTSKRVAAVMFVRSGIAGMQEGSLSE